MSAMVSLESVVVPGAPICYGVLMPGQDTPGGVPVVKVRDYDHRGIEVGQLLRAAPEIEAPYRRSRLQAGDILLSIRGTTGVVAVAPASLNGANITQDTARIRVHEGDRDFVYHVLQASQVQQQIRLHTIGQAVKGINIASVRRLQLPWPEPVTRSLIARTLNDCDVQRRAIGRLIQAKTTFRRGLGQRLLAGQSRFRAFAKSTSRQPGQFGSLPSDWRVVQIGDVAAEVIERGASDGSIVYSCTKHGGLIPSLEYFGKQVFSRNLDAYKRIEVGDFAYATNHIEEGSIGLLSDGQKPGLVSPMYTVFRADESVYPAYLFALLKTESYRRVFAARMSASVDRRGSLRWKEFARIKIGLPSVEEQEWIVRALDLVTDEIAQLTRLDALVERQKRALLDTLLSRVTAEAA